MYAVIHTSKKRKILLTKWAKITLRCILPSDTFLIMYCGTHAYVLMLKIEHELQIQVQEKPFGQTISAFHDISKGANYRQFR